MHAHSVDIAGPEATHGLAGLIPAGHGAHLRAAVRDVQVTLGEVPSITSTIS
jgi:hypothetical protein